MNHGLAILDIRIPKVPAVVSVKSIGNGQIGFGQRNPGCLMKTFIIPLPILGLLIGTRAAASAGIALILADKLEKEQKKAIGWTLLVAGIVDGQTL